MRSYFISDLHLDETRPAVTRAFLHYLEQWAGHCDALYILGDFFEVWVGDDDDAPLAQTIISALKRFSTSSSALYIMHGNRDFLLGDSFCQQTGATLLPDPILIDLYGQPTLLMHGDSLCTRDSEYMAFRQQARSADWQQQLLSQPLAARRALAAQLREQSQSMNALKADDIMDVTPAEVEQIMRQHQSLRLIHGHTHRPQRHPMDIDGQTAERIVLGDWCDKAWILEAQPQGLSLQSFAL
ncbi:UDP-2,3-diacylglucosamine diphosphatase [Dasania marina]|uniref:UDP-2,3-diacylglucosamine diphosphatase n=1 Tax=Dasania marina TaxID=471499 RepID=UPI0030DBD1B0|tara:strand:- start:50538 stop:51260 length:723 start_codon:yes stop_codon:yes gene_type:complete